MAMTLSLFDFGSFTEKECTYRDERYLVRYNGEILRSLRIGKSRRPMDNKWTFGNFNAHTGYLEINAIPVHRVVATAFHGDQPSQGHVVDHIDTNKWNNKPDNLRWVTRLENIILNPTTAKRIAFICGSVEAFLADPQKFQDAFTDPEDEWLRRINRNDGQVTLQRMLTWLNSDEQHSGKSLVDWVNERYYTPTNEVQEEPKPSDIQSLTLNAVQRNWMTPSEFPCCPRPDEEQTIKTYADKLQVGSTFCCNQLYTSLVVQYAISSDDQTIFVITENKDGLKSWALATVVMENEVFVHSSLGSFFTRQGAGKQFCLAQGLEWTGGDSIDDYC